MTQAATVSNSVASVEDIQKGWHDLTLRVGQLEAEKSALEQENKSLRFLLERVIEHRQKSHGELILLLTGLVSKLPINDVGIVVAKLMEHNNHVSEMCAAFAKGKADAALPQPAILKAMDQLKRELAAALKKSVEDLIQLDPPLDAAMLRSLVEQPENFFSPAQVRANRGFIKGQVPRERIVKEFGEGALGLFNDMTTDKKLNPHPKPEEIMLAFRSDFESVLQQNPSAAGGKADELRALSQKVQRSKAATEQARSQRNAFNQVSFILELMHYYENQSTEAPDVVFAQRLPVQVEQLVVTGPQDPLDDKLVQASEHLLAFIINPDHRLMVINNIGKGGGSARTLKFVLRLRAEKISDPDQLLVEFVKHLIPAQAAPPPKTVATALRLLNADRQRLVVHAIMETERLKREEAVAFGKAVGTELGLSGLDAPRRERETLTPEFERQMAWDKIKDLITNRTDPAAIAVAMRERLHAKYDADEIKQSWITLTEADPISLIRVFCNLPYLPDGRTDPVARAVMETYVTRLTHEKYAATYNKVVNSLKNMFRANANSPTLLNFVALVKWVDAAAAQKMAVDVGLPVTV
jgi:hypothetical protein